MTDQWFWLGGLTMMVGVVLAHLFGVAAWVPILAWLAVAIGITIHAHAKRSVVRRDEE